MIIGISREVIFDFGFEEKRVGLTPAGVKDLTALGAEVFVETKAGEGAGYGDNEYVEAGAKIAYQKEEVYRRADILVKIARPVKQETWGYLRDNQVLMGFLSLPVAPKDFIKVLIDRKITAIGYEVIETEDMDLPILKPMSQIAGTMSIQIAGRLLENTFKWGRGVLLSGIPGVPAAEVVVVGAGTLGMYAARAFSSLGVHVYLLDRSPRRLESVAQFCMGRITTLVSNRINIEKLVRFADVLVLCANVPGVRAPVLVTKEMVKSMRKGAVLIDFSIDQGGCSETSRLTPEENFVYQVEGVIHFCVPNVPAWVARTASKALSNVLVPYLSSIARNGLEKTLKCDRSLRNGLCTYQGSITNRNLAGPSTPFVSIDTIIGKEPIP